MKTFLRVCRKVLIGVIVIYAVLIGLMFIFQRDMMYFPPARVPDSVAAQILPDIQMIHVVTEDGIDLKAYLLPPKDATKPVLLAFHGNGAHPLGFARVFSPLRKAGYGLLLAEYRGYGGNKADISEQGFTRDAEAYFSFIKTQYPKNPFFIYGQSLGTGVAVDIASRHVGAYRGLILEVPFDSILSVVAKAYPFVPFTSVLVKDQYRSIDKIAQITSPKLFLIAGQDEVVGAESGRHLYAAAHDPKEIVEFPTATHMTVYDAGAIDHVQAFIEKHTRGEK